jgi:hypothetical protein
MQEWVGHGFTGWVENRRLYRQRKNSDLDFCFEGVRLQPQREAAARNWPFSAACSAAPIKTERTRDLAPRGKRLMLSKTRRIYFGLVPGAGVLIFHHK